MKSRFFVFLRSLIEKLALVTAVRVCTCTTLACKRSRVLSCDSIQYINASTSVPAASGEPTAKSDVMVY